MEFSALLEQLDALVRRSQAEGFYVFAGALERVADFVRGHRERFAHRSESCDPTPRRPREYTPVDEA